MFDDDVAQLLTSCFDDMLSLASGSDDGGHEPKKKMSERSILLSMLDELAHAVAEATLNLDCDPSPTTGGDCCPPSNKDAAGVATGDHREQADKTRRQRQRCYTAVCGVDDDYHARRKRERERQDQGGSPNPTQLRRLSVSRHLVLCKPLRERILYRFAAQVDHHHHHHHGDGIAPEWAEWIAAELRCVSRGAGRQTPAVAVVANKVKAHLHREDDDAAVNHCSPSPHRQETKHEEDMEKATTELLRELCSGVRWEERRSFDRERRLEIDEPEEPHNHDDQRDDDEGNSEWTTMTWWPADRSWRIFTSLARTRLHIALQSCCRLHQTTSSGIQPRSSAGCFVAAVNAALAEALRAVKGAWVELYFYTDRSELPWLWYCGLCRRELARLRVKFEQRTTDVEDKNNNNTAMAIRLKFLELLLSWLEAPHASSLSQKTSSFEAAAAASIQLDQLLFGSHTASGVLQQNDEAELLLRGARMHGKRDDDDFDVVELEMMDDDDDEPSAIGIVPTNGHRHAAAGRRRAQYADVSLPGPRWTVPAPAAPSSLLDPGATTPSCKEDRLEAAMQRPAPPLSYAVPMTIRVPLHRSFMSTIAGVMCALHHEEAAGRLLEVTSFNLVKGTWQNSFFGQLGVADLRWSASLSLAAVQQQQDLSQQSGAVANSTNIPAKLASLCAACLSPGRSSIDPHDDEAMLSQLQYTAPLTTTLRLIVSVSAASVGSRALSLDALSEWCQSAKRRFAAAEDLLERFVSHDRSGIAMQPWTVGELPLSSADEELLERQRWDRCCALQNDELQIPREVAATALLTPLLAGFDFDICTDALDACRKLSQVVNHALRMMMSRRVEALPSTAKWGGEKWEVVHPSELDCVPEWSRLVLSCLAAAPRLLFNLRTDGDDDGEEEENESGGGSTAKDLLIKETGVWTRARMLELLVRLCDPYREATSDTRRCLMSLFVAGKSDDLGYSAAPTSPSKKNARTVTKRALLPFRWSVESSRLVGEHIRACCCAVCCRYGHPESSTVPKPNEPNFNCHSAPQFRPELFTWLVLHHVTNNVAYIHYKKFEQINSRSVDDATGSAHGGGSSAAMGSAGASGGGGGGHSGGVSFATESQRVEAYWSRGLSEGDGLEVLSSWYRVAIRTWESLLRHAAQHRLRDATDHTARVVESSTPLTQQQQLPQQPSQALQVAEASNNDDDASHPLPLCPFEMPSTLFSETTTLPSASIPWGGGDSHSNTTTTTSFLPLHGEVGLDRSDLHRTAPTASTHIVSLSQAWGGAGKMSMSSSSYFVPASSIAWGEEEEVGQERYDRDEHKKEVQLIETQKQSLLKHEDSTSTVVGETNHAGTGQGGTSLNVAAATPTAAPAVAPPVVVRTSLSSRRSEAHRVAHNLWLEHVCLMRSVSFLDHGTPAPEDQFGGPAVLDLLRHFLASSSSSSAGSSAPLPVTPPRNNIGRYPGGHRTHNDDDDYGGIDEILRMIATGGGLCDTAKTRSVLYVHVGMLLGILLRESGLARILPPPSTGEEQQQEEGLGGCLFLLPQDEVLRMALEWLDVIPDLLQAMNTTSSSSMPEANRAAGSARRETVPPQQGGHARTGCRWTGAGQERRSGYPVLVRAGLLSAWAAHPIAGDPTELGTSRGLLLTDVQVEWSSSMEPTGEAGEEMRRQLIAKLNALCRCSCAT